MTSTRATSNPPSPSRAPADCSTAGSASTRSTKARATSLVAKIFGGNDSNAVASALAGGGAGSSGLLQKLLPILAPIVLAYIGKQLSQRGGGAPAGGTATQAAVGRRWRPWRHPRQHPRRCRGGRRRREQPAGQHPRQRDRRPAGRCARRHPRWAARRQEVDAGRGGHTLTRAGAPHFIEWRGDRQFEARSRRPAQIVGSGRGGERALSGLGGRRLLRGRFGER